MQYPKNQVNQFQKHPTESINLLTNTLTSSIMGTVEFNCQFKTLEHKLLPTAYRLTNNYEDARDLVQETALRAFNNRRKFEMGTNFQAWVITIMRNTFINFYRKKKNRNTRCEPTGSFVFENSLVPAENSGDSNIMMAELLGMLDKPESGSYKFQGTEVSGLNEKGRSLVRKQNIGFIFQNFNLIDELTVFENIELPLIYNKVNASERKKRVNQFHSFFDIHCVLI